MTISHETQDVKIPRSVIKAFLFCTIVVAASIVPFNRAAAQNGVAVIGSSPTSTPYGCTTVGSTGNIQQAIADAIAHTNGITQSVVDASNCTNLTITQELDVATGSGPASNGGQRIKFILPANGTWTATINNPNQFAFMWGDGAMIYGGTGSGEGQPFTITAGSGSSLAAVCGNDRSYGQYFHAEGFTCSAANGAMIQRAVLVIDGAYDESYVGHVNAASWGATAPSGQPVRVLWIHAACCSATFEDINAEGGNTSNAVPCVLGDFNGAIHVSKLSCVHPGSGQNAVQIYQSGSTANNGVGSSYKDIYMEQVGTSDTSTPYVAVTHLSGTWVAADLLDGFRSGVDVAGSTRCMVDIGTGSRVNIANLSLGSVSTCAVKDEVNGITVTGAVNSVIAGYDMTPRYGLTLGATTVGTLPPAASNAGAMFRVSDSTSISHEGQTCMPGGSHIALAFSNGSVWKCF